MTLRVSVVDLVARAEASGSPGLVAKAPKWGRVPLGHVARVVNGAAFKAALFNVDGVGMPLLRIRDVGAQSVSTWYDGPWDKTHRVRKGDLVVGMDGDFRADVWRIEDALLNQRVCRIDIDERRIEPAFLRLALPGYLDLIWGATSAVTVKHLSSRSIAEIPLPLPERAEQRRIVEILEAHLSHLDAASADMTRANSRLDFLIEAALRSQLAGSNEFRSLAELLEAPLANGKSVPTRDGGFPVLRLTALKEPGVDLSERKSGAWDRSAAERFLVAKGDFLIARGNGSLRLVGRGSLVRDQPDDVAFPDTAIRARPRHSELMPEFLDLVWNSRATRDQVERVARTSAGIYKVNQSQLEAIRLPVPGIELQRKMLDSIMEVRATRDATLQAIDKIARRSSALRRAVLAAAFEGKLTGRQSDTEVIEEMAHEA